MKFRKKPVVIEAIRYLGSFSLDEMYVEWGKPFDDAIYLHPGPIVEGVVLKTLEGNHRANVGDWIIKGIKNEFYPCKDDIFRMTYEKVEE